MNDIRETVGKILYAAVPFIWAAITVWGVRRWDANYFWTDIFVFWVPTAALLFFPLPGGTMLQYLKAKKWLKPFFITNGLMYLVCFYFEFAGLGLGIWGFSEAHHHLVKIPIFTAPVEEFLFWFGAAPLCILLYLYFYRMLKKSEDEILEWAAMGAPFIGLTVLLYCKMKDRKVIYWPALILLVALFFGTMAIVEKHSIDAGHWVFNKEKVLPIMPWLIPIEEFAIYYIFGPICTVLIFHFFALKPVLIFGSGEDKEKVRKRFSNPA